MTEDNQIGPKSDRDWLEYLLQKVIDMQAAQDEYFRNKSGPSKKTYLTTSIKHETELKQLIQRLVARGYQPGKWKGIIAGVSQSNIF